MRPRIASQSNLRRTAAPLKLWPPLPTNTRVSLSETHSARRPRSPSLIRKPWIVPVVALAVLFLCAIAIVWYRWFVSASDPYHGLPTYNEIWDREKRLPQHNPHLNWPEGRQGRYIKFATPYRKIGFNNQLQDILLSAQIALMSNRAYVFQSYMWDERAWARTLKVDGRWRSSVIPLNAFIGGPSAGEAFAPGTGMTRDGAPATWAAPRAVTYDYFDKVCPPRLRKYVNVRTMRTKYGLEEGWDTPTGNKILEAYAKELLNLQHPCVVIGGNDHVFTFSAFGKRIVPAFEVIKDSPILTNFSWSPFVQGIVSRNLALITDAPSWKAAGVSRHTRALEGFSDLAALHIRRGDFKTHCPYLSDMRAGFHGWNQFPQYLDKLGDPWSMGTDAERLAIYMEHCLPTIDQVVAKLRAVKQRWEAGRAPGERNLTRVYLMTNAEKDFRNELKLRLLADGWKYVSMSQEMLVHDDEREVDMAADMMIAQQSEVFIGNGFSSLTSNVNLLRMARKADPDSIRLW